MGSLPTANRHLSHSLPGLTVVSPLSLASSLQEETMAMAKLGLILALVLLAILMAESQSKVSAKETDQVEGEYHLDRAGYNSGSLKSFQCPTQCGRRCSKTQYKKPCLFFCNKCCAKCLCVPAGYYGNKGSCPCYNNWKTKRGGPKCP